MTEPRDPFLRRLKKRREALDLRATALDMQEAEIRAERTTIAQEREEICIAERLYQAHLNEDSGRVVPLHPKSVQNETASETSDTSPVMAQWMSTVSEIVLNADRGLANDEVKAVIRRTPLGNQLNQRETGRRYYNTISLLARKGIIVNHNRRVYSPEAYKRFIDQVEAGLVEDDVPVAKGHFSPMGEAILELAAKHTEGLSRYDLIAELDKNPLFSESLAKHQSFIYNVLAKLLKRGQLEKIGDLYRLSTQNPREATQ